MLMPPYPTIRMLVIGHAATPVNVEAGLADCEVKYAVCVEQYKVGRVFISDSFDCNLVFAIYPPSRDEAEDKIGNANASARLAGIRGRLRTKPLESAA